MATCTAYPGCPKTSVLTLPHMGGEEDVRYCSDHRPPEHAQTAIVEAAEQFAELAVDGEIPVEAAEAIEPVS